MTSKIADGSASWIEIGKNSTDQQNLSFRTDRTKITILYGFCAVQEKSCTAVHQFAHLWWHTVHKNQEIKLEIGKEFPGTPLEGHFGVVRRQDIISELAKAVYNNPNITVRTKHKAVKLMQNEKEATVQVLTL